MSHANLRPSRRAVVAGASAALVSSVAPIRGAFAQNAAPLKIGVVLPTSGFLAEIGQACLRGAQAALPVLKELGYPAVELMPGDTESNPEVARAAGERLIGAGAHALTGAFDSGHTTTLAQVAEQRGIPLMINIAAAPPITEQGYKFVSRNFPRAPEITVGAFDITRQLFSATGKTPTKAVAIMANDTFGTAMRGAFQATVPNLNLPFTIADYITYDPQARDLSVEVAKTKATGAELVLAVSRLNDAILITREMVKQRWEPWGIISTGPGYYEGPYMKTLGRFGQYPISTVPWFDPRKPLAQKMRETHLKMFPGAPVDTNTCFTFEAVLILADAYKRARSTAPQAMAEAIRATKLGPQDCVTIGDGVSFDAKGQNNGLKIGAVQNLGGQAKLVLPLASAEASVVFPAPGWQSRR